MTADELMRSVAAVPPRFAAEVVREAVEAQYGMRGEFTELVSERDQNFCLRTNAGKRYVVKIASFAEEPKVTDFQIAALLHLEAAGVSGVPAIVRSRSGGDRGTIQDDDGNAATFRIVSWLDGRLLDEVGATTFTAGRLGDRLAALDLGLRDFSHDGDHQLLLWDTQRAAGLRPLLAHVDEAALRQTLASVLDDFEARVKAQLERLPRQVIHNDANSENILVDESGDVCGLIDFGDMLRAPRIVELSTAAAYLRFDSDDPLYLIAPLVRAYHDRCPLDATEVSALFDLVRTRLAMTLLIFYWRLDARETDDPYRQKSLQGGGEARRFLDRLNGLGRDAFMRRLQRATAIEAAR